MLQAVSRGSEATGGGRTTKPHGPGRAPPIHRIFAAVPTPSPTAQTFAARGKLLLTGEYLVLDGARALALPTHPGQGLRVVRTDEADVLHWRSRDHRGRLWLDEAFSRALLSG